MKKPKPKKKSAWPQPFRRIKDADLKNTRRKENFNFAKLCGVMADYGFNLLRLSDDWEGADAIAVHIDGKTHLRIQLKGTGLVFAKKYLRKTSGLLAAQKPKIGMSTRTTSCSHTWEENFVFVKRMHGRRTGNTLGPIFPLR